MIRMRPRRSRCRCRRLRSRGRFCQSARRASKMPEDRRRTGAHHSRNAQVQPTSGKRCRFSSERALPTKNKDETRHRAPTACRGKRTGFQRQRLPQRSPKMAPKVADADRHFVKVLTESRLAACPGFPLVPKSVESKPLQSTWIVI